MNKPLFNTLLLLALITVVNAAEMNVPTPRPGKYRLKRGPHAADAKARNLAAAPS